MDRLQMSTGKQIRCHFAITNNWMNQAKITVQHFESDSSDDPDAEYTDILPQGGTSLITNFTKFSGDDDYWRIWVIPYPYGSGDDYACSRSKFTFPPINDSLGMFTASFGKALAITSTHGDVIDLDKISD